MKKKFSLFLKFFIAIFIFLVSLGGLSELFLQTTKYEEELWYNSDQWSLQNCAWTDSFTYHPFFGLIAKQTGRCKSPVINKQGFQTDENFDELSQQNYNILLLGGSVANQLYILMDINTSERSLNKCLNERFKHPSYKKIVIHNASMPSSGQPIQLFIWQTYGYYFDSMVSVEGFNELGNFVGRSDSLESVILTNYIQLFLNQYNEYQGLNQFAKSFKTFFKSVPVLNNTKIVIKMNSLLIQRYYSHDGLLRSLTEQYKKDINQNVLNPLDLNEFLRRYEYRLQSFHSLLVAEKKPYLVVLQPVPSVDKKLTPTELKNLVGSNQTEYLALDQLFQKHEKNRPWLRYRSIFKDRSDDVYIDYVHTNSSGTEQLVERLCEDIGTRFKFQRR